MNYEYKDISVVTGLNVTAIQTIINIYIKDKQLKGFNSKEDRILRAKEMERIIFKMIDEKKDVFKYVIPFSSYCA